MEETRTVREVVQDEILSERTQRYRRNVIALSVVAIAIHGFDFVDFSKLSLFGLEIQKGQEAHVNPKTLALTVLWLLIAYNTTFGGYGAFWDWRQWISNLTAFRKSKQFYPEIQMYSGPGHGPRNLYGHRDPPEQSSNKSANWEYSETDKTAVWTCYETDNRDRRDSFYHYLNLSIVDHVNEKKQYFYLTEIGIPSILLVMAITLAARNIF